MQVAIIHHGSWLDWAKIASKIWSEKLHPILLIGVGPVVLTDMTLTDESASTVKARESIYAGDPYYSFMDDRPYRAMIIAKVNEIHFRRNGEFDNGGVRVGSTGIRYRGIYVR